MVNNVSSAPRPGFRRLYGYSFDPSLSTKLDTALVNETVFNIRWEEKLADGPIGEYLEVIDYDPSSKCFYAPIDLNNNYILAQDGLRPSESNPQFHQQMVYAVAMTTIQNFERALGRSAMWSAVRDKKEGEFLQRLRIYPHALRQANAYYSPNKKALLFGYFPASDSAPGEQFPGGIVFTCLSHDIIAHETTHALLDGMHQRFIEPSHPDTLAFHEAFADIVALFQHFTFPEVLRHQIAKTRGNLSSQNLLGELAQQFGRAIGRYGALREYIGAEANPSDYQTVFKPHDRGAILVAAVFSAFREIYNSRVADLLRIATSGSGVLPAGDLHPDLVNRLAKEASKIAQHVLNMCIRALDYCPPVDISFGDYLRAIITADMDLVPDDDLGYRVAFIDAFRGRGIYPRDIRTLSEDSLCWNVQTRKSDVFKEIGNFLLRNFVYKLEYVSDRKTIFNFTKDFREKLHAEIRRLIDSDENKFKEFEKITGLYISTEESKKVEGLRRDDKGRPKFQIHSLCGARRIGPDGDNITQVIVSIIQTRLIPYKKPKPGDETKINMEEAEKREDLYFKFRGGCNLIFDLNVMFNEKDKSGLRWVIKKAIDDEARLQRQRDHRTSETGLSLRATYSGRHGREVEPFAFLHNEF